MYRVYCDGYILHEPAFDDVNYMLISPVITDEINKVSSFTFSIPPTHVNIGRLKTLKSIIEVFDDDRKIFSGRILNYTTNWDKTREVVCESVLAFLNDTIRRPYSSNTYTVQSYLSYLLGLHNYRTTSDKEFRVGTVNVSGTMEIKENDEYPTIWTEIENNLLSQFGGYLFYEEVLNNSVLSYYRLNYYADSPYHCTQKIRFGENLLDLNQEERGENVVTRLIPLGAKKSDGRRLTIAQVNDGYIELVDTDAEQEYGCVWGTACWDNITNASELKTKGQQYLAEINNPSHTLQLTALDLHLLDSSIEDFRCGYYVTLEDEAHGITDEMLITKKVTHLTDASQGTITIGSPVQKISAKSTGTSNRVEIIENQIRTSYVASDGTNETTMESEGLTITDETNTAKLSSTGVAFNDGTTNCKMTVIKRTLDSANTEVLTLANGVYLAIVTHTNNTTATQQGLYLIQCYTNSCVLTIAAAANSTLSISGNTLTWTTTNTYRALRLIKLT